MKVLLYYNAEKLFSGVNVCYVIFLLFVRQIQLRNKQQVVY